MVQETGLDANGKEELSEMEQGEDLKDKNRGTRMLSCIGYCLIGSTRVS
jgi:hypothetical protein